MHQFSINIFSSMQMKCVCVCVCVCGVCVCGVCVCVCVCVCLCEGGKERKAAREGEERNKDIKRESGKGIHLDFLSFNYCHLFWISVASSAVSAWTGSATTCLEHVLIFHLHVALWMRVNFLILRPVVYVIRIKFKIKYFVMLYLITNVNVIFLSVHYIPILCIQ